VGNPEKACRPFEDDHSPQLFIENQHIPFRGLGQMLIRQKGDYL